MEKNKNKFDSDNSNLDEQNLDNQNISLDINENLGKFTSKNPVFNKQKKSKIASSNKIIIKNQVNNFSKFKNQKNFFLSKLSEKFNLVLRTKKYFILLLISEIVLISIFVSLASILIAKIGPLLDEKKTIDGPMNYSFYQTLGKNGFILCIVAICPFGIPILYLITSFFIGINQVLSSKSFHLFLFLIIFISFVMIIIGTIFCLIPLKEHSFFLHH